MKLTALVVEENPDLRETLALMLREKGLDVVTASDGEDSLAKYYKLAPDILLADHKVHKIEGLDLIELAHAGPWKTVTILMTAYPSTEVLRRLVQVKSDHYLTKPIQWEMLEQIIDETIHSLKRAADANA